MIERLDQAPAASVQPWNFTALPGRGVQAVVEDASYVLRNHCLIKERGQCTAEIEAALRTHEREGRTVKLLAP